MGWVGVVLKRDIAAFSELLAIGLSTGLMGSITTYASWNQAMIVLITNGFWLRSIVSLIVGKSCTCPPKQIFWSFKGGFRIHSRVLIFAMPILAFACFSGEVKLLSEINM